MTSERGLAVVDIGSNSARLIVARVVQTAHLEILSEARVSLQLARHLDARGRLAEEAVERTVEALRDFQTIAQALGVETTATVATAAIRDSANRDQVIERIRNDTGLKLSVIDGDVEARLALLGAVQALPVQEGLVVDVGGGSLEVSAFRRRRPVREWTFPLGALRVTDRYLGGDPPRPDAIDELRELTMRSLREADVPTLKSGQSLVGTGGTIRNLAKIDLSATDHPIARIHGYRLSLRAARAATTMITSRPLQRRARIPGLSADRADSITGGAVVTLAVMDALEATEMIVSGQGLREGVLVEQLTPTLPSPAAVRQASITALASRFSTWDRRRAHRRSRLASEILDMADPSTAPELRAAVEDAAILLDIGRSIDCYGRWSHAASIVINADLQGFSHHGIALLAATIERSGRGRSRARRYARLLDKDDMRRVDRAATALSVAEELDRRLAVDGGEVRLRSRRDAIVARAPIGVGVFPPELQVRFKRTFGRSLVLDRPPR